MAMRGDEIEAMLQRALPGAAVTLTSLVDDGDHYSVHVAWDGFAGKSRVAQHKLVYQALGGRMGGELHALQVTTAVPN